MLVGGINVMMSGDGETIDESVDELQQCFDGCPILARHCNRCIRGAKRLHNICHLFWRPGWLDDHLRRTSHVAEGTTRHDLCNICCYLIKHRQEFDALDRKVWGVEVPIGISKMKALHTLRVVSVACGKVTFQELSKLTQLRKLGVADVTKKNNEKFWRAIAQHNQLQSLSVRTTFRGGSIDDCLGETLYPPKCLESLKINGILRKLTEWFHRLQKLSKLQLSQTLLYQDGIDSIGKLPNLAILRLDTFSYVDEQLRVQRSSFRSLSVLQLDSIDGSYLEFEEEAMPKLELLQICMCWSLKEISGLQFLISLKEIRVDDSVKVLVQRLAEYPNNITLKLK